MLKNSLVGLDVEGPSLFRCSKQTGKDEGYQVGRDVGGREWCRRCLWILSSNLSSPRKAFTFCMVVTLYSLSCSRRRNWAVPEGRQRYLSALSISGLGAEGAGIMVGEFIKIGGRAFRLRVMVLPSSSVSMTPASAPLLSAVSARDDCSGVSFIEPVDGRTTVTGRSESIVGEKRW